ncbi:MAG: AI-2E family transporter, partial [Oscillospiraceae bacterium]|nr:AI-2E family transporter [Oscillospiraceae bacterium]
MKFKRDSKMTTRAIYAFIVIAAAIVFYLLLQQADNFFVWGGKILSFITPVIYGFVIAYLLNPLMRIFDNKVFPRLFKKMKPGTRRGLSILLTYLIALIVITLFLALILPQIIYSLIGIGSNVPSYLKSLQTLYYQITESMAGFQILEDSQSTQMIQMVFDYIMKAFESLLERLGDWLTRDFFNNVVAGATKFTSGVIDVILGTIISIYFLA